jgi:hypothetical protein
MFELNTHLETHKVDAQQRHEEARRQRLIKEAQKQNRKSHKR